MSELATATRAPRAGEWFELARPHLAEDLLAEAEAEDLQRLAEHLPGNLTYALDLPLGDEFDDGAPPRFMVGVNSQARAGALVQPLGNPLGALLNKWAEGAISARAVGAFSYSLPLHSNLEEAVPDAVPSVQLERSIPPQWFMETFLPIFHRHAITERQKFSLLMIGHQLPESELPIFLTSLGEEGIRFGTYGWSGKSLLLFLDNVSLSQLAGDVSSLLPLWAAGERRMLTLEFGPEGFAPRLQLESSFLRQPSREPRWQELVNELVERELATPEKGAALLEWPGLDSESAAGARWPDGADGGVLTRELGRIQWLISAESPPETRAVLTFGQAAP